jgi:hypothetical protein
MWLQHKNKLKVQLVKRDDINISKFARRHDLFNVLFEKTNILFIPCNRLS